MVFNKSLLVCRLHPRNYKNNIFDIVITYHNKRRGGVIIAKLGHLNLNIREKTFFLNFELLIHWLNQGVKLNKSVKKYIHNFIIE